MIHEFHKNGRGNFEADLRHSSLLLVISMIIALKFHIKFRGGEGK